MNNHLPDPAEPRESRIEWTFQAWPVTTTQPGFPALSHRRSPPGSAGVTSCVSAPGYVGANGGPFTPCPRGAFAAIGRCPRAGKGEEWDEL